MLLLLPAFVLLLSQVAGRTPAPAPDALVVLARPAVTVPDSTLRALYERGISYATFVERAERRAAEWKRLSTGAVLPDALVMRARATGRGWKLLAVAVDGCSDSVNTIPYLAQLVAQLPGVELRIIGASEGRAIMEAHRTPDGRAATPTVLLLDEGFVERGAFIERPVALQQWVMSQRGVLGDTELFTRKMAWYDTDKGASTLDDVVTLMERAVSR